MARTMRRLSSTKSKKIKLPRALARLFPQVRSAVDADAAIEVSVNAKDCAAAKKLNPSECALAQAAKRELHADAVIIGMSASYIIKGKHAVRFHTPVSVQREIVSFDRHGDFAPGDYYLTPFSPALRMGMDHRDRRGGPTGGTHKAARRKQHLSARIRVLPRGARE